MTRPGKNAQPRQSVLRKAALALTLVLGAALPLAAPALADGYHHERGWRGESWHGQREVRRFAPAVAAVPAYRPPVYGAYAAPAYAPPVVGATFALPGFGLFFNIR